LFTFLKTNFFLLGEHAADFSIDKGGIIRVQNPSILDRETVAEIVIQVVANDGAEPPSQRSASVPVKFNLKLNATEKLTL